MSTLFTPLDLKVTPLEGKEVFPLAISQGIEPLAKLAAEHLQKRLENRLLGLLVEDGEESKCQTVTSAIEPGEGVAVQQVSDSAAFAESVAFKEGVDLAEGSDLPEGSDLREGSALAEGKMFGVLVVKHTSGAIGYLAAFSGKLRGRWCVAGFVPPPFDVDAIASLLEEANHQLQQLEVRVESLRSSPDYIDNLQSKEKMQRIFQQQMSTLQRQHQIRKQKRASARQAILDSKYKPAHVPENPRTAPKAQLADTQLLASLAAESQEDKKQRKNLRRKHNAELQQIDLLLNQHEKQIEKIEQRRQALSRQTQESYFSGFHLYGADGEIVPLFAQGDIASQGLLPPSGTGECAAPKLLSYANQQGYTPISGTEFWWGRSPAGKIRHHKTVYPPCQSKCRELLPRLQGPVFSPDLQSGLQPGLLRKLQPNLQQQSVGIHDDSFDTLPIEVLFEDRHLAVVGKPAGLLSVPGKTDQISLYDWARRKWPEATGPLLVHRLDMDTSGLVLLGLEKSAHKHLQKQFLQRSVKKYYSALVAGKVKSELGREGYITLPLRVDLDDRPRQMVCFTHGRSAITYWKITEEKQLGSAEAVTRLSLQPLTGRTHQLRVHTASAEGLGMPIIGDPLYAPLTGIRAFSDDLTTSLAGDCSTSGFGITARTLNNGERHSMLASRMMLHAERLEFVHPVNQEQLIVSLNAPF